MAHKDPLVRRAYHAAWVAAHPGWMSAWHRRNKYDLSEQQFQEMLAAQGGKCLICGGAPGGQRPLSVDHNHETGQVRGLLCQRCNTWLAGLENREWIGRAQAYLRRFAGLEEVA